MATYDIAKLGALLKGNEYPGRGIVIGKSEDGNSIAIAYFIMGRSANSRNRVFTEEGDTVTIYPADSTKVEDPSLIIYHPIRKLGDCLIVTNGDQTDTIFDFLKEGNTFEEALETREFEPDGPNWTPRISGIVFLDDSDTYKLSILKSEDPDGTDCARYTYTYKLQNGLGHFIHTYKENGNPIPTFEGEPERVAVPNSADEFASEIWDNLNEDNKISLYVRYINVVTGAVENELINKYSKVN